MAFHGGCIYRAAGLKLARELHAWRRRKQEWARPWVACLLSPKDWKKEARLGYLRPITRGLFTGDLVLLLWGGQKWTGMVKLAWDGRGWNFTTSSQLAVAREGMPLFLEPVTGL